MRYAGKAKRAFLGRMAKNYAMGRRPSWKKAVVQLAEGEGGQAGVVGGGRVRGKVG